MNKYLIAAVMAVLVGVGYSQRGEAAACVQATIATYTAAGFTCDIGDKTFSNFSEIATDGAATGMMVTPIKGPPFWGFQFFTPSLIATGVNAVNDIAFGYTATCNGNGGPFACINSAELSFTGSATGTGTGQIGESVCITGTSTCFPSLSVATGGPSSASDTFAPQHSVTVLKDANVSSGANGTASISIITNTVDQVPEPASLALLGAGLFGLAAFRRRKMSM